MNFVIEQIFVERDSNLHKILSNDGLVVALLELRHASVRVRNLGDELLGKRRRLSLRLGV